MQLLPQSYRRRTFLIGVTLLLSGLVGFALLDSRRLRFDLALGALKSIRHKKMARVHRALEEYQQARDSGDPNQEIQTGALLLVEIRRARVPSQGDARYRRAITRLGGLGKPGTDEIFRRLRDPGDPYWLLLFDAVESGLKFQEDATGALYRERMDAFQQDVLNADTNDREANENVGSKARRSANVESSDAKHRGRGSGGPRSPAGSLRGGAPQQFIQEEDSIWPLRVRLAIHKHRRNPAPEDERRDLGAPCHDAVPFLIDLLESVNLFDRLAAAGALENLLCRSVDVSRLAGLADWSHEARQWRDFWRDNRHRARADLIADRLRDPDASAKLRADACQRLADTDRRHAEKYLIKAIQDSSLRLSLNPTDPVALGAELVVQARALGALARLGHPWAIKELLAVISDDPLLGTGKPLVSLEELESLGRQAGPFVLSALCDDARGRRDGPFRHALQVYLKEFPMDERRARENFYSLAASSNAYERDIALRALTNLVDQSDGAYAVYARGLKDKSADVRLSAAVAMLRFGTRAQAVPVFIELINHDDDTIAQSANVLLQEAFPYGPKIQPAEVDQDRAAIGRTWQRWWDAHRSQILQLRP